MCRALLMVYRMSMKDPFNVLAFWSIFDFYSMVKEGIMDKEIPCSVHGDPDAKEKTDVKSPEKTCKDKDY
jgi:hypothetical protein